VLLVRCYMPPLFVTITKKYGIISNRMSVVDFDFSDYVDPFNFILMSVFSLVMSTKYRGSIILPVQYFCLASFKCPGISAIFM